MTQVVELKRIRDYQHSTPGSSRGIIENYSTVKTIISLRHHNKMVQKMHDGVQDDNVAVEQGFSANRPNEILGIEFLQRGPKFK